MFLRTLRTVRVGALGMLLDEAPSENRPAVKWFLVN
jgi:hypothetical protein